MSLHVEALNYIPHLSAYIYSSSTSFWKLICCWADLIALYIKQSSANTHTCDETDFGRLFMCKRNNNDLRTSSCLAPELLCIGYKCNQAIIDEEDALFCFTNGLLYILNHYILTTNRSQDDMKFRI